ncbi:hypothetical protein CLOM_g20504 [Closterium sp. NIES-68]|nr:hypothetical protein CLOM_g20504 [Closterium sp. NIES-68]
MKLGNTRLMSIASIAAAMGKSGCCSSFTGICSNMVFRAPHRLPLLPSVRGQTEPAPAPEESQAAWSYLQVCCRWRNSFLCLLIMMVERPELHLSRTPDKLEAPCRVANPTEALCLT